MTEPSKPIDPATEEAQDWLKDLAAKSWEPELIISGAAIYLTSGLPEWIDNAFHFYEINLAFGEEVGVDMLATLGLLFFKCAAYMLTIAFVTHFTLRAFWVAMVGLLSVFPQDIDYQKVPKLSDHAKQVMREKLGTFQAHVVQLDRLCSNLLSVAFFIALSIANIAFLYLVIFMVLSLTRLFVPAFVLEDYGVFLYFTFLSFTLIPALFMGLGRLAWVKARPEWIARLFAWQWGSTALLFPLTRNVFTRLGYMFQTNIPPKVFRRYQVLVAVVFAILIIVLRVQLADSDRIHTRTYFGSDDAYRVLPAHYDNLRPKGGLIRTASIQTEVLKDNYLKLFIAYPKKLDPKISPLCPKLNLPDSMPREKARTKRNQVYLACFEAYFKVYVNDSLYRAPGFVWHLHPNAGERGVLAYLSAKGFRHGANQLRITEPHPDSVGVERKVVVIPFWYLP
jgi:hypothetical protein